MLDRWYGVTYLDPRTQWGSDAPASLLRRLPDLQHRIELALRVALLERGPVLGFGRRVRNDENREHGDGDHSIGEMTERCAAT